MSSFIPLLILLTFFIPPTDQDLVAACPEPVITSQNSYDKRTRASNILIDSQDVWSKDSQTNYWLTKNGIKGPDAHFIMDLQCRKDISALRLTNTHNGQFKEQGKGRGTKKFR